uniref:Uncharacterized protein n=1 Tax=viral metagenome TaxID=1070528 RepID=A0A6C0B0A9_9ZZZZ
MDLTQRKLIKSEWESIEIPLQKEEIEVLQLIILGVQNVNIKTNKAISLLSYLKVENNAEMEDYLYMKYFDAKIKAMKTAVNVESLLDMDVNSRPKIKKADIIRLERNDISKIPLVYELVLIDTIEKILIYRKKGTNEWLKHYFTLHKLHKNSVYNLNKHIVYLITRVLAAFEDEIDLKSMISKSVTYIEKNEMLLKYSDMMLYEHQKEMFTIMKNPLFGQRLESFQEDPARLLPTSTPKLVLLIAPTGTGKTLTPIGLSEQYRVIFVCAARHVGLALAKSAISIGKKIAFAFGCASADDIRLHYFSAKEYKKHKKSGGIGKVDNSVGDKVEIMICDVRSYLCAMFYMLAFNPAENIVTFWDEPTITMDQESHDLHPFINKNWRENLIPNIVLSSATLPKLHELTDSISYFREKFAGAQVHNIVSHDCKKSIPIINKHGYIVLPHILSENYDTILEIARHCRENLTLLRYFDLDEVIKFILFIEDNNYYTSANSKIERNFASLDDITMQNIKLHYLRLLEKIQPENWQTIYNTFMVMRQKRILPNASIDEKGNSLRKIASVGPGSMVASARNEGKPLIKTVSEQPVAPVSQQEQCAIFITTKDAYTLTDGPTIFLAEDVEKIAKFCIQQANIPVKAMESIVEKIEFNNNLNERIEQLEMELETLEERNASKVIEADGGGNYGGKSYSKKSDSKQKSSSTNEENDYDQNKSVGRIHQQLEVLRSSIKTTELNETFVPNKLLHQKKWAQTQETTSSFTSNIDETIIIEIMMLKNVENSWKVLLLMGVGVFTNHPNIAYTEIMKKLADTQKLYMIIASSDYIYGTNYQFCHGYLSKDLLLTQEKMIQALGRIGRNHIQQTYSIRLRDDEQIKKLFYREEDKPEVRNMNRLFSGEVI